MGTEIIELRPGDRAIDQLVVQRIVALAAPNEDFRETLRKELAAVTADLAGPDPTPVELMLAKTAGINWFEMRRLESIAAVSSATASQIGAIQSRIDRTHRRLMLTLRTLATVRRLALPSILVSLAKRQLMDDSAMISLPEPE